MYVNFHYSIREGTPADFPICGVDGGKLETLSQFPFVSCKSMRVSGLQRPRQRSWYRANVYVIALTRTQCVRTEVGFERVSIQQHLAASRRLCQGSCQHVDVLPHGVVIHPSFWLAKAMEVGR